MSDAATLHPWEHSLFGSLHNQWNGQATAREGEFTRFKQSEGPFAVCAGFVAEGAANGIINATQASDEIDDSIEDSMTGCEGFGAGKKASIRANGLHSIRSHVFLEFDAVINLETASHDRPSTPDNFKTSTG